MTVAHKMLSAVLAAAALAVTLPAAAQWAWRDAAGKMVYSDQPPPASVPAKDVVRQPAARPAPRPAAPAQPQGEATAETAPQTQATAPPARASTPADREIEARKRQQQQAEQEKKVAEEEQKKAQLAENCERLRGYERALQDGFRIARVNAAGQREIIDDATRTAELERTRAQMQQYCQ